MMKVLGKNGERQVAANGSLTIDVTLAPPVATALGTKSASVLRLSGNRRLPTLNVSVPNPRIPGITYGGRHRPVAES